MTKDNLISLILSSNRKIFSIVGPNSSGKSYFLNNDLLNALPNSILILDEEGRFHIKDNRRKVKIIGEYYVYDDENNRGKINRNDANEKINVNTLKIVHKIIDYRKKFESQKKSLGSRKLLNILNALLSYNLNHIEYFLFDEPENSLDDERIKYIGKIFDLLISNNKKVVFITHSPRLLELLQINIDDIFVFPNIYAEVINHTYDEIKNLFNNTGNLINQLKPVNQEEEYAKYDFLPYTNFSELYLSELLKNNQFYRVLFYSHVIIVEGRTEELLTFELSKELDISKCIFNAGGKYKMLFLIKLFSMFCHKVSCVIDSDIKDDDCSTLPSLLTLEIEKLKKDNKLFIYSLPNDLETYLGFDKKAVVQYLTKGDGEEISGNLFNKFKRYYKHYLPFYVIKTDMAARIKIKQLFNSETNSYKF